MRKKCLIIGGGASGLLAALKLAEASYDIEVLEARDTIGGRICTLNHNNFSIPLHTGAEFIHGHPELTMALLKDASINFHEITGCSYQVEDAVTSASGLFDEAWEQLIPLMNVVEGDVTFAEFLQQKFPEKPGDNSRERLVRFVEGYHAADIHNASTKALAREWQNEKDPRQFRPQSGYGALIDHISNRIKQHAGRILLSKPVIGIRWRKHAVEAVTQCGQTFLGQKCVVTIPLGMLQNGSIQFDPPLAHHADAASHIGFGAVIKFFVEFDQSFWTSHVLNHMPDLSFLFSDAPIPTWWSQLPNKTPILTGWLGGPAVLNIGSGHHTLEEQAVESLAYAFKCAPSLIRAKARSIFIKNWHDDKFTAGAYSFATPQTPHARRVLNTPVEDTLFFAGEALYDGLRTGTVEAALCSGQQVAEKIIQTIH